MNDLIIGSHRVGRGQPCYFIAEIGVNHNGSMDLACQLVDAAVEAGANAVKFQAFDSDKLVTNDAPQAEYQSRNMGAKKSQKEMLDSLALSPEEFRDLKDYCKIRKIDFLCTPFDEENARLIVDLGCNAIKIGSGDLSNHLFLVRLARLGLPLILSTGMSNENEVREAVAAIRSSGNAGLILLQCVSNYPASPETMNLRAMQSMEDAFHLPAGLSDHTLDDVVALAAVALGASVIEKHLTLDRNMQGPDHAASLEPSEFATMIQKARIVEAALGSGRKIPVSGEDRVAMVARRSLAAAVDIPPDTEIAEEHLTALRPAGGIPPSDWRNLVGRRVRVFIPKGVQFQEGMLS
jgi:N-acetylneuraminate synthase